MIMVTRTAFDVVLKLQYVAGMSPGYPIGGLEYAYKK
jgi:hypothetical protein